MVSIKHVIFGRVEPDYSPKKESGYQVVYASHMLPHEVVSVVEKQVKCFSYHRVMDLQRLQFFWPTPGLAAMVQSSPARSDPEIIDKNERGGAFIAHAILISKKEFSSLAGDPFAIFEGANDVFTSSPEKLHDYVKVAPPPERLDLKPRRNVPAFANLSAQQWETCFQIGRKAGDTAKYNQTHLLKSEAPNDIISFLSSLHFLLDAPDRTNCTFDTHIDACEPKPGTYWIVGGQMVSGSNYTTIDLSKLPRGSSSQEATRKSTPYANWFTSLTQCTSNSLVLFEQAPYGQRLAASFESGWTSSMTNVPHQIFLDFWQANKNSFTGRLAMALQKHLSNELAAAMSLQALDIFPHNTLVEAVSHSRVPTEALADPLFKWLINQQPDIKDWKNILSYACESNHPGLQLLASNKVHRRWAPLANRLNRVEATRELGLKSLSKATNRDEIANSLLKVIPADWLISRETACLLPPLTTSETLHDMNDSEFTDYLLAILQNGGAATLTPEFAERAQSLRDSTLTKELTGEIRKANGVPEEIKRLFS